MDYPWVIVDEREGVGRVDTWSEYLCVKLTDDDEKIDIAVCRHEVIGEIPSEWFDDDGVPLPEFSDENGYLVLPEFYEGWAGSTKLTGHDGGYLLGELTWDEGPGPPITAERQDVDAVSGALKSLGWSPSDTKALIDAIRKATSKVD
ncbi:MULTISPECIES: hypothetical protein [Pseudomonadota]|jgi:hypothetical protein|uniref:hypothetical protein n=1 Tax=Pseudomonadota TaxID=1224 RepID=UPI0022BF1BDC|nr:MULTISPECIES: hypothetical protein [Pseudomonadota]MCZ8073516.1 hypothetical protein [Roseateles sp.]MCZ8093211.1 hypothetical protein [Acidovorax sp.]MCZ8227641.1 hypothetical protein [Burkholderiaceae bacterium]MCZ8017247.1 hypothetical protein [Limnobacter sp.]MCZ8233466.1 hypothetical protein [Novosphingobium sp.]